MIRCAVDYTHNIIKGMPTMNTANKRTFAAAFLLARISAACGIASLLLGALVLLGWALDIETLKRVSPDFVSMNPTTAAAFILSGLVLLLQYRSPAGQSPDISIMRHLIAVAGALLVLLIGLLVVCDYTSSWQIRVDQILFPQKLAGDFNTTSNRMAPNTALSFVLLGLALLLINVTSARGIRPSELLAIAICSVSIVGVAGYIYDARELYAISAFIPMAVHTTLTFGLLGFGILAARPREGIMAIATGDSIGQLLLIRILPMIAISVFALGWLRLQGESQGYYSAAMGVTLYTVAYTVIVGMLLVWVAYYQRESAAAMRKLRAERNHFFELSADPACITSSEGLIREVNEAFTALLGYTRQELISRPVFDLVHPDDQNASIGEFEKLWSGQSTASFVNRYCQKDGDWKTLFWSVIAIPEDDLIYASARDVSEEKTTARELERAYATVESERARLKTVLDTVIEGVISVDQTGRVETFNSGAERLFGYQAEEVIGQNIRMLMPKHYRKAHDNAFRRYLETGQGNVTGPEAEVTGMRKDGSHFPIELSIGEVVFGDERHFTGIVRDVSERTRLIAELTAAREQADKANAAKSEFLATMSHEIRTPMNGVIGMLDVLHHTSLQGHQVEMVDLIQDSADSLLAIVNDILDFSKIEAGEYALRPAPCDVGALAENVCVSMVQLAEKQLVQMTMFIDPAIPSMLNADEQLLRQVLTNLINNAIKFSSKQAHQGRFSVRCECIARSKNQVTLEFRVQDNGIGMDSELQGKLFRPFTQAENASSRKFGGTGLGLAISKSIAELMGGDISVESELGSGSTFTFRVPLTLVPDTMSSPQACNYAAGLSCMVVGDENSLAPDIATYLAHGGAKVKRFENPVLAREWVHTQVPGVWLWVIDAGENHLSLEELGIDCDVATGLDHRLQAVVIERGKRHNLRQKADGVLIVDGNALRRKTLLRAVALAAGRSIMEEDTSSGFEATYGKDVSLISRENARQSGRLVLVAEDNINNQNVIRQQLAVLGTACDIADNGYEALKLWRTGNYPLLLTDLYMPVMDGYELTRKIRDEEAESSHMGIVALTANAASAEFKRCIDTGMDAYLSKPVHLEEIDNLLKNWLPPIAARALNEVPTHSQARATARPDDAPRPEGEPVNVDVLRELVGGAPQVVDGLLLDFQNVAVAYRVEIHRAWESGSLAGVGAVAHKLKSSARTVGALALGDCCERIEAAANQGDKVEVEQLMHQFDEAFQAVIRYLKRY